MKKKRSVRNLFYLKKAIPLTIRRNLKTKYGNETFNNKSNKSVIKFYLDYLDIDLSFMLRVLAF